MSEITPVTPRLLDQYGNYLETRVPTARRSYPLLRQPPQPVTAAMITVEQVYAILTEADTGNAWLLLALYDTIIYSDNHMQAELAKRKLAVLGDPLTVTAKDPKNPDDVRAAALVQAQFDHCSSLFDGMSALLDSVIWPVSIVERTYRLSSTPGLRYDIDTLIPIVYSMIYLDPTGPLRIRDVDRQSGSIMGTHQMVDPMRYITHRGHLLGDRDHRGGPLRSLVFWWLFSGFDRDWWVRFLDKYGSPFLLGKFDQTDDESRAILQQAFSLATKLGGIVVSRQTEVELVQAMSQSQGEAYDAFHECCQREKSKLILGQTTSSSARDAGGLGSGGVSQHQSDVRDDIRQFDRMRLAETLRQQLALPFLKINAIPGNVTVRFGGEDEEDTSKTAASLAALANAGIEATDEGIQILSERMAIPLRRKLDPAGPGGDPTTARPPGPISTFDARPLSPHAARAHAADAANAEVAGAAAAPLARAFREDLAPIMRILRASSSPADFEHRLRDAFPQFDPKKTLPLIESALRTYAGNGL